MGRLGRALVVLAVVVLLVYILAFARERFAPSANLVRHKTDEYVYGHYSAITRQTKLLYPSYWLTTSRSITLEAGDSLWIPQHWWHWVKSEPQTVAINMWTTAIQENMPDVFLQPQPIRQCNYFTKVLPQIKSYSGNVVVWNSQADVFTEAVPFSTFLSKQEDDKYIITLDAHATTPGNKFNHELYTHVASAIHPPALWKNITSKNATVESNLWISSGKHDTGLHYDNSYGMLTVLQGRKHVELFSPSQTKYLSPLSTAPKWATQTTPIKMEYNVFTQNKAACGKNTLPSARLLYETLKVNNGAENFIKLISLLQTKLQENNIVYGVKQVLGGAMRWEMYSYHYDKWDKSKPSAAGMDAMLLEAPMDNVVVHSKDFVSIGGKITMGPNTHTYKGITSLLYPHFGTGHTLGKNNLEEVESMYVISDRNNVLTNIDAFLQVLKYTVAARTVVPLLKKYTCKDLALFQKYDGNVFIIYMGISVEDFASFLVEHKYPAHITRHVGANISRYRDIVHEVAVVYNLETLAPVRTAFYGVL
jgi:hypothetical protein